MTSKLLANYKEEQALFTGLVESDGEPNILLFQGESGSGKSHLIEYCLDSVPDTLSLLMKLQGGGDSVPALFTSMGGRHGWENLPRFTHTFFSWGSSTKICRTSIKKMDLYASFWLTPAVSAV